jgi:glycine hydroxymethyltransferase
MGLIAGGQFQDPFAEGADVLAGSTHKTISGPQRGIVATNDEELSKKIDAVIGASCFLQSNFHPATLVALGVALAEVKQFGRAFAVQIIKNAQALAKALDEEGIPVLGSKHGYTQSHQVILKTEFFGCRRAVEVKDKLEEVGIISDKVPRFGVQEITRLGMKEAEMKQIAVLIADAIQERRPPQEIRKDVRDLAAAHQKIHFSFQDGEEAYSFIGTSMLRQLCESSL